ncbi:hypothetical protein M23134_07182 [Microscilla marina ATCC 23134]|uniref:Uncharacterized protein n=1 Tax=Microscilla marina ATCC 23134 TaxID=313606 RepID=A1ZZ07_MICM2|nr:hypothetical protein M23134_07182 [Microscilla marina ATCC 23134]
MPWHFSSIREVGGESGEKSRPIDKNNTRMAFKQHHLA